MATTTIRIIEGAAGCGKTAQALDACRQCVAEHGFDAALVLVPTGRVGDLIRGRLWHEGLSGLFDFRVLTFGGLADALLLANHVPVAAVNDLQQQYLVGRAVAEMTGAELGPLAAQRDRLGLIASVAGLINEMKAAGVSPEALGEALAKGRADAIERAAVRAYARYQKLLQDRNLYDAAGMLWQAQEALAEGKTRPFERTRLVIADGFSDFTTTQLRVLARLAAIAEETIITLTCEPGEDRPELQRVPARTRAALEEHLGPSTGSGPSVGTIERVTPACPEAADTDLGHLRAHLFDAAAQPRDGRDETVRVLRAPGPWAEVRLAAREIKRLLTRKDGAARPTDIAILTRSLDAYQGALRGVFDEYDLPLFVAGGEPAARRACVRLAADLLRLVEEDFPRAATVAVLDSTFLSAGRLVPRQARDLRVAVLDSTYLTVAEDAPLLSATAAEVDEVARKAGIVGGRELWMKALDRLAVRTERRVRHAEEEAAAVPRQARDLREAEAEDEEERAPSAEEARALLDKIARVKASFAALAEMLAPLAKADSRRGFVAALLTVLSELGVGESVVREGMGRPPRQARDLRQGAAELRAWNALVDALETLGDVDDLMAGGEIEAGAFAAEARAVIGGLRTKPSGRGEGRVVALGVHDALQSSYDYVFILGLTEGSFPLRAASDPLLPDDRRKALEAGGLAVRPRKAGQDDEAYLFHLALTRARRALYLCYPDTDAAGGELLRSYYVNEAARLLPGVDEAPVALMMRLRDVVPPLDQAAGARELAERALMLKYGVPRQARDLRGDHPDKGQEGAALQMLARGWDAETLHAAEHGAQVELVRAGRPPARFGPYDGVLARPDVIEELKRRFGPQHFWSASQLGSYGACPMGFLFERVLGIEELEEPEHEVKLMEQGLLLHRILTRFYRERVKAGLGHVAGDEGLDAAAKMLREAEEDGFAWYERGGLTGNEALWAVTKDVVRARLTAWLEAEALIPDKLKAGVLEPALFEHAYGDDEATALVLDLEVAGKAMVRGRIDRLDLVGEGGFVVFDYKRGGAPGKQATEDGADFQLAFYAMVGERLACPGRRCAAWAYIRVGMPVDKALEGKVVGEGETEGLMKLAEANAESHILMMRGGYFPWPAKCGGARFCAFSHICRWEPRRGRIRQRAEHDPSTGSGAHPDG